MPEPQTINKAAETAGQYPLWSMVTAVTVAAFSGGFFNSAWKYLSAKIKKNKKNAAEAAVQIAEMKKEEHTEDKLWLRVENLELHLIDETEKRLKSEKTQSELQRQIDELKRDKLFTLSRYIHLKLRIEEAKREIQYLKAKLMEKDPDFDKDYPNFSSDSRALEDEKLINDIVKESQDVHE
jgi:superfamily I DNA/RNA helicase